MKSFRLFLASAMVVAGVAFVSAAGLYNGFPNATPPLTGAECIPADSNLTQGLTPATECLTAGQITGLALHNAMATYSTIPIGSVAYGSLGTNTTPVAGTIYWTSFQLPIDKTITNIECMNGGTAGTDKLLYAIYNGTSGALIANTATAGVTASGTDSFQSIALTAPITASAGRYFIAWQTNGTTTRFRTVAASTFITVASASATGTFGTLTALTVPTTFTADKAPICAVN